MNDSHIFFPVWTSPLKLRLVYLPVWHLHRQFKLNKYKVELKFPIKLAPLVDVPTAASGSFIFLVPNLVTYSQLLSVFIYNPSDSILQQILSALPSWIGEGNGKPLQCSFLENPRDGGAWWAAISGVAQSRTRLKQLSSSSYLQNLFWIWPLLNVSTAISSVQLLSHVRLFAPHGLQHARLPVCHQIPELLKLMTTESVMPSNHLILCYPLLPPSIFPSIRVFFQGVSSSHYVARVLELQLQHRSFQWILMTDFL